MNKIIQILQDIKEQENDDKIIGSKYEEYVASKLSLANLKYISSDVWKRDYKEYRKSYLTSNYDFLHNFTNITLESGKQDDNLVIHQPNGSQRSPDLLIIKNKIGFFVEVKTGKINPAWNSGRLHDAGLYIFKNYKLKQVTYFLKSDIIDSCLSRILDEALQEQYKIKEKYTKLLKQYSIPTSKWTYDNRAIFQDKNDYFGSLKLRREDNVKNFLLSI